MIVCWETPLFPYADSWKLLPASLPPCPGVVAAGARQNQFPSRADWLLRWFKHRNWSGLGARSGGAQSRSHRREEKPKPLFHPAPVDRGLPTTAWPWLRIITSLPWTATPGGGLQSQPYGCGPPPTVVLLLDILDPMFAINRGPTQTHAWVPGRPAIHAGQIVGTLFGVQFFPVCGDCRASVASEPGRQDKETVGCPGVRSTVASQKPTFREEKSHERSASSHLHR